jgi:hypothetical protein
MRPRMKAVPPQLLRQSLQSLVPTLTRLSDKGHWSDAEFDLLCRTASLFETVRPYIGEIPLGPLPKGSRG